MPADSGKKLFVGPASGESASNWGCRKPRSPRARHFSELYQPDRAQPAPGDGADPAAARRDL